MTIVTGGVLAAAAGCATGVIDAYRGARAPSRGRLATRGFAGAALGALAYSGFLLAGFAVALLLFSDAPDPGPALLGVVLGCACFLVARWLQQRLFPGSTAPGRRASQTRGFQEVLDARPPGGRASAWIGGMGLAILFVLYGVRCIVTRKGELGVLLWPDTVEGGAAVALGVGWIGVGMLLHFHFLIGSRPGRRAEARRGKIASLVAACVGLATAGVWSSVTTAP